MIRRLCFPVRGGFNQLLHLSAHIRSLSTSSSESCDAKRSSNVLAVLSRYGGPRVLLTGEGDFGFARTLAERSRPEVHVTASTMSDRQTLLANYPQAAENIDVLLSAGGAVLYNVDATCLPVDPLYDSIAFNFPHINGKQNIKKNRELLQAFLASAKQALSTTGKVKLLMTEAQTGACALSTTEWKYSWMASAAAAEAGMLLTEVSYVDLQALAPSYSPLGRRGKYGSFSAYDGSNAVLLTFQAPDAARGVMAAQAPLYAHELHLLSPTLVSDVAQLEMRAAAAVAEICAELGHPHALWTCHLVDVYICPQTQLISHALEMSYCSLHSPVGRGEADALRTAVESGLLLRLQSSSPSPSPSSGEGDKSWQEHKWTVRTGKLGGRVSLPHSWQVAQALQQASQHGMSKFAADTSAALQQVSESMQARQRDRDTADGARLSQVLRKMENESSLYAVKAAEEAEAEAEAGAVAVKPTSSTAAIARLLWGRRIGVLMNELCEAEESAAEIGGWQEGAKMQSETKNERRDNVVDWNEDVQGESNADAEALNTGWYVYLLTNPINKRTYLGSTTDYTRRLRQHNGDLVGGARYTHMHAPKQWRVHCVVSGLTKQEAMSLEGIAKNRTLRPDSQAMSPASKRVASLAALMEEKFPHAAMIMLGK